MKDLRIIFMGTPDFAVTTLQTILENEFNVVAVITAPDKPAGRGRKLRASAVKEYAVSKDLPVLQPTNLKDPDFVEELRSYQSNLHIVVAFRMLPKVVWDMASYGTFNLHASLLPHYRGAAPINWAIINGEEKTGITTFFIDEKIDTGHIIMQEEVAIHDTDTAGILHDRLMNEGALLVIKTINAIAKDEVTILEQPKNKEYKTAYKLNKDNTKIDWNASITTIYNLIRGLSPYPSAWCYLHNKGEQLAIKLYDASCIKEVHSYEIGKILIEEYTLKVAVKDGFISINKLQIPGKKVMDAKALLNGFTFYKDSKML